MSISTKKQNIQSGGPKVKYSVEEKDDGKFHTHANRINLLNIYIHMYVYVTTLEHTQNL